MLTRLFLFLTQPGGVGRFGPLKRLLWRRSYEFQAKRYQLLEWQVMNYGFTALPAAEPIELEAADEPERYGLQLYHRVAGAVPLAGCAVLEVGCGRGGGAAFVQRSLGPATMTAVDFSHHATDLCQRRYSIPGLSFQHGDAERLPLPAESFDAVVNVESSHCYGSVEAFFREVRRVLKPGGHLLYADFRDAPKVAAWREQILVSGLHLVSETDITANVVAALDADSERRLALVQKHAPKRIQGTISDLAGVRGSVAYENLRTGQWKYLAFVLRKDEAAPVSPAA